MKELWVDLKASLGLTNTASSSSGKIEAGFLGDVISWATSTPLWSLLYSTIFYILKIVSSYLLYTYCITRVVLREFPGVPVIPSEILKCSLIAGKFTWIPQNDGIYAD